MPRLGIMLVDVYSFKLNRLTIEKHDGVGLSVSCKRFGLLHFETAEADTIRHGLTRVAVCFDRHNDTVQVGLFGTPPRHFLQQISEREGLRCAGFYR